MANLSLEGLLKRQNSLLPLSLHTFVVTIVEITTFWEGKKVGGYGSCVPSGTALVLVKIKRKARAKGNCDNMALT